jgi:electron transfer flavoprotein beta subunit
VKDKTVEPNKTIVCIKPVVLSGSGAKVRSAESYGLNPFDRPALEVALQLREKRGGTVTVLAMGPEPSSFVLNEAMAMGADAGILLSDRALAGSDTLATSTALGTAIQHLSPFDLVLFGTRSSDSDTGHVGPQTAVLLNLPLVTGVYAVDTLGNGLRVERRIDDFRETYQLPFPAVLTVRHGSVRPRDIGLLEMASAFEEKELVKWSLKDLGLSPEDVGDAGSGTAVISLSKVQRAKTCEFLSGSKEEQVEELLSRLLSSGLL